MVAPHIGNIQSVKNPLNEMDWATAVPGINRLGGVGPLRRVNQNNFVIFFIY